jgi:hypothetical protein
MPVGEHPNEAHGHARGRLPDLGIEHMSRYGGHGLDLALSLVSYAASPWEG